MNCRSVTHYVTAAIATVLLIACAAGDDPPAQEADGDGEMATATEGSATAATQTPAAWRVELAADQTGEPTSNAWSPSASAPEALTDADGDFSSSIRYMCFSGGQGEVALRLQAVSIQFQAVPHPVMMEEMREGERGQVPLEVRTTWGGGAVALRAYVVGSAILFDQTDEADRAAGRSSNAEFLGRLLRSGSTGTDAVEIELDWEDVGPVRYAFSLEGAAAAIREAGRPCGVE